MGPLAFRDLLFGARERPSLKLARWIPRRFRKGSATERSSRHRQRRLVASFGSSFAICLYAGYLPPTLPVPFGARCPVFYGRSPRHRDGDGDTVRSSGSRTCKEVRLRDTLRALDREGPRRLPRARRSPPSIRFQPHAWTTGCD